MKQPYTYSVKNKKNTIVVGDLVCLTPECMMMGFFPWVEKEDVGLVVEGYLHCLTPPDTEEFMVYKVLFKEKVVSSIPEGLLEKLFEAPTKFKPGDLVIVRTHGIRILVADGAIGMYIKPYMVDYACYALFGESLTLINTRWLEPWDGDIITEDTHK